MSAAGEVLLAGARMSRVKGPGEVRIRLLRAPTRAAARNYDAAIDDLARHAGPAA